MLYFDSIPVCKLKQIHLEDHTSKKTLSLSVKIKKKIVKTEQKIVKEKRTVFEERNEKNTPVAMVNSK